jgi:uncharacterized protein YutE (UPF0331/DUF86 family)
MRYLISVVCVAIIVLRALFPDIHFDSTSLTLLIISIVIMLFPEMQELISRIRKLRIGQFEVEISEKLKDLAERTTDAEEKVGLQEEKQYEYFGYSAESIDKVIQASKDPRGALLILAVEIERTVRKIAKISELPEAEGSYPLRKLITIMADRNIIDPNVVPIFRDFWSIRNLVVHGQHYELSEGKIFELVDLGLRVIKLLDRRPIRNSRDDQNIRF